MSLVGQLKRVPLREVWPHEATDFTRWLEQNLDLLSELTGLTLQATDRERTVGEFRLDLLSTDDHDRMVVIENQYQRTDHDHLGKLVTYAACLDAAVAIWIAEDPRPEHATAVGWLNQQGGAQYYLIKIEAVRIDESRPAPLMTVIAMPSRETAELARIRSGQGALGAMQMAFWTQLLDRAAARTGLHHGVRPRASHYVGKRIWPGLSLNYVLLKDHARLDLYLSRGAAYNTAVFEALLDQREAIERRLGHPLSWQPLDSSTTCRIAYRLNVGPVGDEEAWPAYQDEMIEAMIRFEAALRPDIDALDLNGIMMQTALTDGAGEDDEM